MSDLQCAATLLLAVADSVEDAVALARASRDRRVAVLYTADGDPAARVARVVSERLGVPVQQKPELSGSRADDGADSPSLVRACLDEIADAHRGETVLVLGEVDTFGAVMPGGVAAAYGAPDTLRPGALVELHIDADGWTAGQRMRW